MDWRETVMSTQYSENPAMPVESVGTDRMKTKSETVNVQSRGQLYPAYLAYPRGGGNYPGIVMIHSYTGLEPGYKEMADNFASEGFVIIAPEWQTHGGRPPDEEVGGVITSSVAFLKERPGVDPARLGLTGFCAGGRYTMLFLPQVKDFGSGVPFYGFPYSRGFADQATPASHISSLDVPMLIIHGTADQASHIADIYKYATELDRERKYFELKVYQGEPHGFMVQNKQLSMTFPAKDAYIEMVAFFTRTLK
jgi:carboxymethylenebutenolidase